MAQSHQADPVPIWARPEPAARRPRFSREQIAAAAFAIADTEGFEAVSMRRIAAILGAGTMSLYRYITTRADLLALIDDALMREALVPGQLPEDWREALTQVARQTRAAYLRHPWAVQALQGRPPADPVVAGPNGIRHFEQSLAALAGAPLGTAAKLDLLAIVDDYVFGHLLHAAEFAERSGAAADSQASGAEFMRTQIASGDFPHLAALAQDPDARALSDPGRLDERFERGLRLIIDGAAVVRRPGRR
jgi:AcrR family transcriptional regulator